MLTFRRSPVGSPCFLARRTLQTFRQPFFFSTHTTATYAFPHSSGSIWIAFDVRTLIPSRVLFFYAYIGRDVLGDASLFGSGGHPPFFSGS